MKLFSLGNTEIKCSPFLLLAVPLAIAFGSGRLLIAALLSLCVHEAAHAAAARRLGHEVSSVEAQPYGFVARMELSDASAADSAAIYAAGPTASLVMAAVSALMEDIVPLYAEARLGLTEYNLLIFALNMLPALPLDGGRLLLAAFSKRGARTASLVLRASGVLTGLAFLALFVLLLLRDAFNLTFLIMGAFLIASALAEGRRLRVPRVTARPIRRGRCAEVRNIAVSEDTRLSEALRLIPSGGYTVLTVVDPTMRRRAQLDERQLVSACERLGAGATLREAAEKVTGKR